MAHEGYHAAVLGLRGIPSEAESIMALRDIALAELTGGVVHIAHMSARQTLDAVRYGKARGARVTCEVTPHHFVLTDDMLAAPEAYDTNVKMNPPLRATADRDAIQQGLADGSIDVIATDHAPHHYDEKQVEFDRAPFGITGLETAVSLCFDRLIHPGTISLRAADRIALGESGADSADPGRVADRGRASRRDHPCARSSSDRHRGADAIEIQEHSVRRLVAARRRRRDHRRRPDGLRQRPGWLRAQGLGLTRTSGRRKPCSPEPEQEDCVDRRAEIRNKALRDLQESRVLMINGHFDYGNGYHGRVYLNPHQLFRHPSTIWRFAQDLIDVLPSELLQRTEVVAGPVTGGALLAHTIAGLLDSRRSLTHPPCSFAPFNYDPSSGLTLRPFYRAELTGKRVLLADDVRNTGETLARAAALARDAGATVLATVEIYDCLKSITDLGVPNLSLAEYQAPENYQVSECPLCRDAVPVTRF